MANTTRQKYGGRMKGTKNKAKNTELKAAIEDVSFKAIKSILADFDSLTINDKIKLLGTSLRYIMPQLKATEVTLDTNENVPKWVHDILNDQYRSDD